MAKYKLHNQCGIDFDEGTDYKSAPAGEREWGQQACQPASRLIFYWLVRSQEAPALFLWVLAAGISLLYISFLYL